MEKFRVDNTVKQQEIQRYVEENQKMKYQLDATIKSIEQQSSFKYELTSQNQQLEKKCNEMKEQLAQQEAKTEVYKARYEEEVKIYRGSKDTKAKEWKDKLKAQK